MLSIVISLPERLYIISLWVAEAKLVNTESSESVSTENAIDEGEPLNE